MIKVNGSATKAARKATSPLKAIPFAVKLDGAGEVLLTGDFTNWAASAVKLRRAADGSWSTTLQLAPGEYQYRLLVDGQWRDHPEAKRRVPNPFGTENCVLVVA